MKRGVLFMVKPGENQRKTMGKPWENHRKTIGKTWKTIGKLHIIGKHRKTMQKNT
jgi:hypothetical protein